MLVGRMDIAERLGVKPLTVKQWLHRYPDFPAPAQLISGKRVWEWSQVEAWARSTGRMR